MAAFHLHDPSISATQLLAGGYDIIVCPYEFAERSYKAVSTFYSDVQRYTNRRNAGVPVSIPKRPLTALYSQIWRDLKMPWKRVVLDEAQKVNKWEGRRHRALKEGLYATAYILLSGTLPHNKWSDISGYLDFIHDHPFSTEAKFMRTFATSDYTGAVVDPDAPRLRLLQKFLQAILIARPVSVLRLKDCQQWFIAYEPDEDELQDVTKLMHKYREISAFASSRPTIDGAHSEAGALGIIITAQMRSLHPILALNRHKYRGLRHQQIYGDADEYASEAEEEINEMLSMDSEDQEAFSRSDWLKAIKETKDLMCGSQRTQRFVELFRWVRAQHPRRKMVIFSAYLKYLDIIEEVLFRDTAVRSIRYDGTVDASQRYAVEEAFRACGPEVPLLITGGAGNFPILYSYTR